LEYNVLDPPFSAVPDNKSAATFNTAAIKQAIAISATSAKPGPVVIPMTQDGIYVNPGQLQLNTPGAAMYGHSGMGASVRGAMASKLIGVGPGSLLTLTSIGQNVENLSLYQDEFGVMNGDDALIALTGDRVTQTTLQNLFLGTPHIGISIKIPANYLGEFWLRNIQIQGQIGYAASVISAGNATVDLSHVISSADISNGKPQPQFGHKVLSCGEFAMGDRCDTICCGNCLALVPGHDGESGQYVNCVMVTDSLLDSGNGQGCLLIWPQNKGFLSTLRFTKLWCSSPGNFGGTVLTNGIFMDGSNSTPDYFPAIGDVKFIGGESKSFCGNMGLYARSVDGLSIQSCTFGDNLDGIHIAPGCRDVLISGCHSGAYVPATHAPNANNTNCGIYIEPTTTSFTIDGNFCNGNDGLGIFNANRPRPNQIITPYNQGTIGRSMPSRRASSPRKLLANSPAFRNAVQAGWTDPRLDPRLIRTRRLH